MLQPTDQLNLDLLTAAKAAAGPLDGCKAELWINAHTPTLGDTLASYSIADFGGYAPSATISWGTPYIDQEGAARMDSQLLQFNMTDSDTPNVVQGILVRSTGGSPVLKYAEKFDTPVNLARSGQAVAVVASFEAPAAGAGVLVE